MKDMSIRNLGKFSQNIQCLLFEHWKGKCMTEKSTFTADGLSKLLQTWHDSEVQIRVFSRGKTCGKSANFWNSLKQSSLLQQVLTYRDIALEIDHLGKQKKKKKSFIWQEGSLMISHTCLIILQSF